MNDGFVALTKCYFCNEDSDILLNRRLNHKSKFIQEAHGKIVSMDPCAKCAALMKQGIILITIDDKKSDSGWAHEKLPNPYRTGGWFVIRDEAIQRMIRQPELFLWAQKHRFMFIEHEAAERMGLFEAAKVDTNGNQSRTDSEAPPTGG
jgi:hypothetical protein